MRSAAFGALVEASRPLVKIGRLVKGLGRRERCIDVLLVI
jgi:hypothetical protein